MRTLTPCPPRPSRRRPAPRAALTAAGLTVLLLGSPAAPAGALPATTPGAVAAAPASARTASAAPASVVRADPGAPGSTRTHGTLTLLAQVNGPTAPNAVPGAAFELVPVTGIDVTSPAGRAAAQPYLTGQAPQDPALGEPVALPPTGSDGVARLDEVPLGLYLVRSVRSTSSAPHYTPFYVAIPSEVSTAPSTLAYDLEVEPKPVPEAVDPAVPLTPGPTTPGVAPTSPARPTSGPTLAAPAPGGQGPDASDGIGAPSTGGGSDRLPGGAAPDGGGPGTAQHPSGPVPGDNALARAINRVIPAGDGAAFDGAAAWGSIALGGALVALGVLATRRRRHHD